jgi:FSR family fosmidomycin resistance protein-like MFS transporter
MSSEPSILAAAASAQPAARVRSGMFALTLYCVAHFFIDLYSSALGALQPVLVGKLSLTLTEAGFLGAMMTFAGSLTQPLYGVLSDRLHSRMFSVLAPAVSGLFISAIGLATNYATAMLCVFLGGAGIASFHPQASARATLGVTANRGRWMAVFISAGTLGLAIGPTYFSSLISLAGLSRSYLGAIPGVLATLLMIAYLPEQPAPARRPAGFDFAPLRAVWRPLTILYFCVFLRSAVQITFGQFLTLYLTRERGFSLIDASLTLSAYLACGALGGFVGGHLADKFGGRRVIIGSMLGAVPFLALFFGTTGPLSIFALVAGGLILLFTIPVNVFMAQELVPSQSGTVSALMMGFAWGMAGLVFIPLTGWIADHHSLHTALSSLIVYPLLGFFLSLKLPK